MPGVREDGQIAALVGCQRVTAASTLSGPLVQSPNLPDVTGLFDSEIASSLVAGRGLTVRQTRRSQRQSRIAAAWLPEIYVTIEIRQFLGLFLSSFLWNSGVTHAHHPCRCDNTGHTLLANGSYVSEGNHRQGVIPSLRLYPTSKLKDSHEAD
jgi:hypothetical protein